MQPPFQEPQQLHQQRLAELRRLLCLATTQQEIDKITAQINYWRHYA